MKRIIVLGVALLATFGVVAVNAVSVSASGDEFVASKTGKTKSKQIDSQVFKTSAGTLECAKVTGSGEIKEGKSAAHKEVFTYSACRAFGSSATMSTADFEFSASGPVKLENTIEIVIGGGECEILIEPQTVEKAAYANKTGGKIEAEANALKIHSRGTGGDCGGSNTEGSYNGAMTAELEGGTLEWKS
jgi:hypothetical protein